MPLKHRSMISSSLQQSSTTLHTHSKLSSTSPFWDTSVFRPQIPTSIIVHVILSRKGGEQVLLLDKLFPFTFFCFFFKVHTRHFSEKVSAGKAGRNSSDQVRTLSLPCLLPRRRLPASFLHHWCHFPSASRQEASSAFACYCAMWDDPYQLHSGDYSVTLSFAFSLFLHPHRASGVTFVWQWLSRQESFQSLPSSFPVNFRDHISLYLTFCILLGLINKIYPQINPMG